MPVYSDIHVREILLSGRPLPFIEALEDIGAHHLPMVDTIEDISTRSALITPNVVRDMIPERIDACFAAQLALENINRLLAPLHSAGEAMSLDSALETVLADFDHYMQELFQELRALASQDFDVAPILLQLQQQQESVRTEMKSLNAQRLQQEAHEFHKEFSQRLAREKLDQIPDREIAAALIELVPESNWIRDNYPKGFGREALSCGTVTGFAFMLFNLGVGRFKRPLKGGDENFVRRLKNQFRDCEHIEQAVQCHVFMTKDAAGARLARAVYSYAGLPNEVILLQTSFQG